MLAAPGGGFVLVVFVYVWRMCLVMCCFLTLSRVSCDWWPRCDFHHAFPFFFFSLVAIISRFSCEYSPTWEPPILFLIKDFRLVLIVVRVTGFLFILFFYFALFFFFFFFNLKMSQMMLRNK